MREGGLGWRVRVSKGGLAREGEWGRVRDR